MKRPIQDFFRESSLVSARSGVRDFKRISEDSLDEYFDSLCDKTDNEAEPFKDIRKKIDKIRGIAVVDQENKFASKSVKIIDIRRCDSLVTSKLNNTIDVVLSFASEDFSNLDTLEDKLDKAEKVLETLHDDAEWSCAGRIDVEFIKALETADKSIIFSELLVSPDKRSKPQNIYGLLEVICDILDTVAEEIDNNDEEEEGNTKVVIKRFSAIKSLYKKLETTIKFIASALFDQANQLANTKVKED